MGFAYQVQMVNKLLKSLAVWAPMGKISAEERWSPGDIFQI